MSTRGNPDCHLILRGGSSGPNFDAENVQAALATVEKAGLKRRLMVDTSHDNSFKDYSRQPEVAANIADQVRAGETGIIGLLMESFLVDGRQDLVNKEDLVYGQSITDACINWDDTVALLDGLAQAVRARRARSVA